MLSIRDMGGERKTRMRFAAFCEGNARRSLPYLSFFINPPTVHSLQLQLNHCRSFNDIRFSSLPE